MTSSSGSSSKGGRNARDSSAASRRFGDGPVHDCTLDDRGLANREPDADSDSVSRSSGNDLLARLPIRFELVMIVRIYTEK